MDPLPPIAADVLIDQLRQRFEQLCRGVTDAVNRAPSGHVIPHSEEPVRDLLADFRQEVFQAALQLQIHAAEAAFSPSGPDHGSASRE